MLMKKTKGTVILNILMNKTKNLECPVLKISDQRGGLVH